MKLKNSLSIILSMIIIAYSFSGHAGWRDLVGDLFGDSTEETESSASTSSPVSGVLTNKTAISGLKQALEKASQIAVNQLGRTDGFLSNSDVRIPMPGTLSKVEKTLRQLGASRYADAFVETMNHAAEKAVVEATPVFLKAIKGMSIEDGLRILKGSDDEATQYFRRNTETELTGKMLPITQSMTSSTGVTIAYKKMMDKMGFARQFMTQDDIDIDQYITRKTLDGLFLMIAVEEKKIRTNPVARTTDLLKTVFGAM